MKNYRRILVPLLSSSQSDIVLQRATELALAERSQLLVVRILDTRSGFEPDGPAAILPDEAAARLAPDAQKRLELQLARNDLGWAEAKVVWGIPSAALAEIIRSWKPDLVLGCSGHLPNGIASGVDILTVGCNSMFRRLADALRLPVPEHA